ncbi:MAG TPA: hypothetical protein VH092_00325 [Urbifossiella sp.]|jgi:hypothetical protein|nr:hypothetical protein [Urbifossiella sp.]
MIGGRVEIDMSPAEGLRKSGLRKATRIGLNRASAPVKASVVSHAEAVRRYGFLAKSIRIRLRSYPADRFVAVIGPSTAVVRKKGKYTRGKKKGQPKLIKPSKYACLVEKGTKHSKAKPWLKPAYDETAAKFIASVGVEIGREVDKELAKASTR